MYSPKNLNTQPIQEFSVFNNWNQVAIGWYFVMPSSELKNGQLKGVSLCGQEVIIFRGENGVISALDAYCPHMGTHLARGKVIGNSVQCFFHHWQFNGEGNCEHIPCQKEIPEKAKIRSYVVSELYDSIWVYPATESRVSLTDFPELPHAEEKVIHFGRAYERSCHHHVTMINGLDPQHLKTVHHLDIEMNVDIAENGAGQLLDITLTGRIGRGNLRERISRFLFGQYYSYSMRYDHGNNGFLTLMRNVSFGSFRWPTLHMIFAYRPIEKGRILVQPIYITKKRSGPHGWLMSRILLWLTKRAFFMLQGEDGAVYENMRFYPGTLLSIDRPVAQFIQFINKLPLSAWKLS
jgi:phenylpropionate dioxygenase-like ring-hydroxylating dioxygenase large terminal subunit